jgi:hypothetical protein
LRVLLPKKDEIDGRWSNLSLLYMKVTDANELEFDMDLKVILPVTDNIEFLALKQKGETTYREQPYFYQAQVVKVLSNLI